MAHKVMTRGIEEEKALVELLSVAQREKLRENAHKDHWRTCSVTFLLSRLDEEVHELRMEVLLGWSEDRAEKILREAADVANFAAMIADVVAREEATRDEAS